MKTMNTQTELFHRIKENKFFKLIKYTIYIALSLALVGTITYLNVVKAYPPYPLFGSVIASEIENDTLLDKTAAIIARDGKLPLTIAKNYSAWIFEAAEKYSLDPMLLLAVIYNESKFNHKAVSPTGPIGLFQIASSYHKEKSTRAALFDPYNNIMVGAWILREYADLSKNKIETLLRFNGSLGRGTSYATKVIKTKRKYENEIMKVLTE